MFYINGDISENRQSVAIRHPTVRQRPDLDGRGDAGVRSHRQALNRRPEQPVESSRSAQKRRISRKRGGAHSRHDLRQGCPKPQVREVQQGRRRAGGVSAGGAAVSGAGGLYATVNVSVD